MKSEKFRINPAKAPAVVEQIKEGFNKGLSDEELAKKANASASYIYSVRKAFGLHRFTAGINIFEQSKKTAFNEYSEKIGVVFWIPHDEAKKLGLTESKYEFFGTILGKQKIQITFKDVD